MGGTLLNSSDKPYIRVIDGNIAQTVEKGTEGAKFREYELSDKSKGSKWELVFKNWEGKIQGIEFKDGTYGVTCNIDLGDAILSLNTSDRYFQEFACKLPNGDINEPFLFHPYAMEVDGKTKKGISLQQPIGEKLSNYYYDGEKSLHGFPEVDEEMKGKLKKDYWKVFFAEVAAFLIGKIEEIEFSKPVPVKDEEPATAEQAEEILTKDTGLPF